MSRQLKIALKGLREGGNGRQRMVHWFQSAGPVNQRSLVGLLKAMCDVKPSRSMGQCNIMVLCQRWIDRDEIRKADLFLVVLVSSWWGGGGGWLWGCLVCY